MAIQPTYPGVYVQEESSGVVTITGVSTSVAAFIGMVNRGPLNEPTRILSYADYERAFGDDTSVSEMTDQVKQFFLNGGQQAYIMRIANGATAAEVTVKNEFNTDVLVFRAKDAGEIGDTIRVEVDYDTSSPESSFNVRVFRHESDGQGGLSEAEEEVFSGLTMDPASGQYAVDVITQQSALIDAELPAGFTADSVAFKGYALAGRTFTDANDFRTQIHAAIVAANAGVSGGTGRFRISVDGDPFVDVTVTEAQIGVGTAVDDFEGRINTALLAYGVTVDVSLVAGPNGKNYLLIESATSATAGSVVMRRGSSNDIAADMHFGLDAGGLEVDGYAQARPPLRVCFTGLGVSIPQTETGWKL
jgi:phage tail sheath protein FI